MTVFNWAYIGCGGIAESTARQIVQGNHRIVSVYGRTPEKVRAFAEKYDAKPFADFDSAVHFDGVDGVYIATPHTAHAAYAIRAMELHKPVQFHGTNGIRRVRGMPFVPWNCTSPCFAKSLSALRCRM